MNMSESHLLAAPLRYPERGDEASLIELAGVTAKYKWSIVAAAAAGLAAAACYLQVATPVYRANMVVVVEDSKGPANVTSPLAEAANFFNIQAPPSAEMYILRSRAILGKAVDELQLGISTEPKFIPAVSAWLDRLASSVSTSGLSGFPAFARERGSIQVSRFLVSPQWEGRKFTATLTGSGYQLTSEDGMTLVRDGRFGTVERFEHGGSRGEILVESATGAPSSQFLVERRPRLQVIDELQRSLDVEEEGKQSGVIRVQLTGSDPERIASTLNEIASEYVQQNLSRKSAEAEKTLALLGTMLPDLRDQVERSENRLNAVRKRDGTFDLGTEGRLALEHEARLQTELVQLQQKRKDLETQTGPNHPSMQAIDARIRAVSGEIKSVGGRVRTLPNVERDLARLSRDVKAKTDLYTGLLASSQQLQLVKEGRVGNVRLLDRAEVPTSPLKPKPVPVLAFGATLGLIGGLLMAFFRNAVNTGIKDATDVESLVGMNLISTVPFTPVQASIRKRAWRRKAVPQVLAARSPDDPAVESLRGARAILEHAMQGARSNIVLVTGPTPGVGKSFTSTNLAAVMAAGARRVLLIDADLRKGRLNHCFGLAAEGGLCEVLNGELSWQSAVHRDVLPNLDFLSTGATPSSPADLLSAHALREILRSMSAEYDTVIVDAAALLVASESAVLARLAGTVLLVARADLTTARELQECGRYLVQIGAYPNGVIFNAASADLKRYTAGRRYARYGFSDGSGEDAIYPPPKLPNLRPTSAGPAHKQWS